MKKCILYIHRTQGQGAEGSHIRGMVDAFRELDYYVDIEGPPGVDPYIQSVPENRNIPKDKKTILKSFWKKLSGTLPQIAFEVLELVYNIYAYPRVRKILLQNEYIFIYERYALNTFFGAWLSNNHNTTYVLEVNDATVIERSRPLILRRLASRLERKVLQQANLIVTISNTFKKLLIKNHHISAEKILVLPNAVNPENFILDPHKCIKREDMGIKEDQIVLGCAGAFVPWHGLAILLNTLHKDIRERNLFLLFIGDGPVRADVESLAEKYNISENIHFTGFVGAGKVPYYLDLVDICVLPDSNDHCSPMKLFEYMAMGKAVVLPRYQPLIDTVEENKEATFFEPGNHEGLRMAVRLLVEDKQLRQKLGHNSKKLVHERYTWHQNAKKVLDAMVIPPKNKVHPANEYLD